MAFEQSMTEPPPTGIMMSTPSALAILMPSRAEVTSGFGRMPPIST